jgi:hypothetical protein
MPARTTFSVSGTGLATTPPQLATGQHQGIPQADPGFGLRCGAWIAKGDLGQAMAAGMKLFDHCCYAWNKLVDQPWKIMSIGLRQWAHGSPLDLTDFSRQRAKLLLEFEF